jgi:hypothetical protein
LLFLLLLLLLLLLMLLLMGLMVIPAEARWVVTRKNLVDGPTP